MTVGVITLVFGEPRRPDPAAVTEYLQRIFLANAELDPGASVQDQRRRSRELAERRLPGLLEEYEEIGGSPLNVQAERQAEALETELRGRGMEATTHVGMQFTEPFIEEAVREAEEAGADHLVGLPVYPLCGRSTTVAALDELERALEERGWGVETSYVSGWHRHPGYLELRADALRRYCEDHGLDLHDPDTRLVFSAHGTPVEYLAGDNRYDAYVREYCHEMARRLGDPAWEVGFQNHGNRPVEWTQPEVDHVVIRADARILVVDAVSFMHEQSETLSELDGELREVAEESGREFHRVPIPHDDPRFVAVLADLAQLALQAGVGANFPSPVRLPTRPCRCRPVPRTLCLNVNGG